MGKIRLGFLGATRAIAFCEKASLFHRDDAEVAAVCDVYEPSLALFRAAAEKASANNVRYLTNGEDLLSADVDAIILCNYATEHAPWAIRALNAGKHVLSESLPMQTLAQAVELVETVERTGLTYQYAENYAFFEPVLEMRKRYASGEMGEVTTAEGTFINDLSHNWARLTRGNPGSWRNHVPSTFYCTHSIGSMMMVTGRRAVKVIGMEIPPHPTLSSLGARPDSAAMELMQLDNGGMARAIHGSLKREYNFNYAIYCQNGSMELDRHNFGELHIFREKPFEQEHRYGHERYQVEPFLDKPGLPRELGLSICYVMECFLGSLRGGENCRRYGIDVYRAMDMSLPGFLAYRSILAGSTPVDVPDFRDPQQREAYRNDHACTDPAVAGNQLLPSRLNETELPPPEAYERARAMYERGETDFW